jgi:hypothetical protein
MTWISVINLLTLLFGANIQPFQISQIMGQIKGPQAGIFSLNIYTTPIRGLKNYKKFALGLIADCNDAEKLLQN